MSRFRTAVVAGLMGVALAGFARPAWTQEGSAALPTMNEERAAYRTGDVGRVREVRLALVCYGGSSLAIYIHGNTKEVHRLVQASKALQQDALANGGAMRDEVAAGRRPEPGEYGQKLTGSTRQWYDLLLKKWIDDPQKVRTRVVVDIVAGTSAGGINGVILAKALAHDLPVDDLTRLWLNKASLAKLTNGYLGLFRVLVGRPPVDGNALVGWLFDALNSMDHQDLERGRTPSLLPKGDRLDLFVTTTDRFGYPQNLVVGDPPSAVEKRFRHVLHFVYPGVNRGCDPKTPRPPGEVDHFCPEWTPALAFAARASSSIPGVFPPLNLGDTMQTIAKAAAAGPPPGNTVTPAPLDQVVHSFFRNYELQEPDEKGIYATNTYFVDGGVLDNHPFGPAIAAILSRPQEQEVQRLLLYLQPDPGAPPTGVQKVSDPGLLQTIWAGLSGIPSGQPILDNLNDVAAHNTAVDRIRDIVQSEEQAARDVESARAAGGVCGHLERLPIAQRLGCALGFDPGHLGEALREATQNDLQTVRRRLETTAERGIVDTEGTEKKEAGVEADLDATGRSYLNLRVHSVLDQFVTVLSGPAGCDYPEETAQRALVAKIIDGWAAGQGLIKPLKDPAARREQRAAQRRFLEDFDVGYQRRQLRFVIDWINEQYTANPEPRKRQLLDALKRAAADRVEDLTGLVEGTSLDVRGELSQIAPLFCRLRPWQTKDGQTVALDRQAAAFLADPQNQTALTTVRDALGQALNRLQQQVRDRSFADFKRLASELTPDEQQEILVRYLGFPFWDRQIYPYVAFSELGEFQDIDIYRLSPDDATLLGRHTARDKLVGATKAHFGAFLSRPGRESDYLWGRLDAGDRLLTLLGLGTGRAKSLFTAIVDEEKAAGLVRPSILAERQAEIDKLP
jgi:predicted acylesterase/phospholipase RssA